MGRRIAHMYIRLAAILSNAIVPFCIIAIFLILGITTAEVVWRSLVGRSVPDSISLATVLMPVTAYTAIAVAQLTRRHITVTIVTENLPKRLQSILAFVGLTFGFGLCVLGTIAAVREFARSFKIGEFYSGSFIMLPAWPAKLFVPVGLGVLSMQLLADMIANVLGIENNKKEQQ
jgi:TRAP-type mannitol/chloroaromatic compound transport system permease small subunit